MPEPKVSLTTKDVATLVQLEKSGQLKLQPEFQREGVWPKAAKSYLVDSILNSRPIPPIYIQRTTSVQTGRSEFAIIDGQQRIRAIMEFLADGFPLSEIGEKSIAMQSKGKKYSDLPREMQQRLWNFDFVVQELSGYSDSDNLNANQLFTWRRAFERGELSEPGTALVPVTVSEPNEAEPITTASSSGSIHIELPGRAVISVEHGADARLLQRILESLRK